MNWLCVFSIVVVFFNFTFSLEVKKHYNVAPYAKITASSTCGFPPSKWCFFTGNDFLTMTCGLCHGAKKIYSHPITNVILENQDYWQSENLPGIVTILFDLKELFLISEIVVKPGPVPFPALWQIQISNDGHDFTSLEKFFSESENTFENSFIGWHRIPFSESFNAIKIWAPRQTVARFIRLQLEKPYRIPKDYANSTFQNEMVFYTLTQVKIIGECLCQNEYRICIMNEVMHQYECKCQNNKCGQNCDVCCPGFIPVYDFNNHGIICKIENEKDEENCKSKMINNLQTIGLDLNDWLCSISDVKSFPPSKRVPQLLTDFSFKVQILSEMVRRMWTNSEVRRQSDDLLPHVLSLERFAKFFLHRMTQNEKTALHLQNGLIHLWKEILHVNYTVSNIKEMYVRSIPKLQHPINMIKAHQSDTIFLEPVIDYNKYIKIFGQIYEEREKAKKTWILAKRILNQTSDFKFHSLIVEHIQSLKLRERLQKFMELIEKSKKNSKKSRELNQTRFAKIARMNWHILEDSKVVLKLSKNNNNMAVNALDKYKITERKQLKLQGANLSDMKFHSMNKKKENFDIFNDLIKKYEYTVIGLQRISSLISESKTNINQALLSLDEARHLSSSNQYLQLLNTFNESDVFKTNKLPGLLNKWEEFNNCLKPEEISILDNNIQKNIKSIKDKLKKAFNITQHVNIIP